VVDAGEPVLFNDNTLHVGSLNRSEKCRVSFEITVIFKASA
jgi:ectoine hydroxylase-related dioxygenase (phytanoyl-CoA dioxygenase family)